jgi:hypothetical protein
MEDLKVEIRRLAASFGKRGHGAKTADRKTAAIMGIRPRCAKYRASFGTPQFVTYS